MSSTAKQAIASALIGACIIVAALSTSKRYDEIHYNVKRQLSLANKYGDPKSITRQKSVAPGTGCTGTQNKPIGKMFTLRHTGLFDADSCYTTILPENHLLRQLFPEYDFSRGTYHGLCGKKSITEAANENDILYAPLSAKASHVLNDIMKFPGKIIFFNPGVFDLHSSIQLPVGVDHFDYLPSRPAAATQPDDSLVVLGPHEDSPTSVQLRLMAAFLVTKRGGVRDRLFDTDKKPINTKKFFMIYAVSHCVPYREMAAKEITTKIGRIDVAGKCQGNPEGNTLDTYPPNVDNKRAYGQKCFCQPLAEANLARVNVLLEDTGTWKNNDVLFHDYRFSLVMESSALREGYITEKIINAFLAGTIPVFFGNKGVFDIFNPAAFIFLDPENMAPALERIAYLEQNRTAYDEMLLNEPILKDGVATMSKYFSLSDEIGDGSLKKKIRERLGFEDNCSFSSSE